MGLGGRAGVKHLRCFEGSWVLFLLLPVYPVLAFGFRFTPRLGLEVVSA